MRSLHSSAPGAPALVVRADASTSMGTGHWMRCLALAQAWREAMGRETLAAAHFAAAECPEALAQRASKRGFEVERLSTVAGSEADAGATIALARRVGARHVVVDGYHFEPDYHAALHAAGLVVLAIDDLCQWERCEADLVLNQNAHAEPESYSQRAGHTALLLGTRFALLRPEFARWRKSARDAPRRARRLLVTMGGSDPELASVTVLGVLAREGGLDFEIRVLVGPACDGRAQLERLAPAARAAVVGPVDDVAEQLHWADLAISAAGSTAWELCCLGVPALTVVLADNQEPIARDLARRGVALEMGRASELDGDELLDTLELLRDDQPARVLMAVRGRALVDGRGAERVARLLGRAA